MAKNQKVVLWAGAIIVILATVGIWYYYFVKNKIDAEGVQGIASSTESGAPSSTAVTSTKPASGSAPAKPKLVSDVTGSSLSYKQALAVFANQRIVFNEACKMVPNPVWIKSGTILMFDNPYRDPRTFKLDGTSYTLLGYGFKLFQLRSTKLPHVVKVVCGNNEGTGEITLN